MSDIVRKPPEGLSKGSSKGQRESDLGWTMTVPSISHEGFLKGYGNFLYQGLKPNDVREMYQRAYKVYLHNKRSFDVNPEPPSPEQISQEITLAQLEYLEAIVASMYVMGFAGFAIALGKDPRAEMEKDRLREEEKMPNGSLIDRLES